MTRHLTRLLLLVLAVSTLGACKRRQQSGLLTPTGSALAQPAPDSFRVAFQTSEGRFVVQAVRAWAPIGVDRFHYLVRHGYYDRTKFFRNLPGFVAQFGIHGDPEVNAVWKDKRIPDDPVAQSNLPGTLTFATAGPNTRTVQLFINKRDNSRLDAMGFAPIGRIVEGFDVVSGLYEGYGEGPPRGSGPEQERIEKEGNRYLNRFYPQLDSIITARVIKD